MLQPLVIDHICLWVRSLSEARDYFNKIFNLESWSREGDYKSLLMEGPEVHFFISEDASLPGDFLSRQHVSMRVSSLAEVTRHLDRLKIKDYETGEVGFMQHQNYR